MPEHEFESRRTDRPYRFTLTDVLANVFIVTFLGFIWVTVIALIVLALGIFGWYTIPAMGVATFAMWLLVRMSEGGGRE